MDKIDREVEDNSNILEWRAMDKLDELVEGYNEIMKKLEKMEGKIREYIDNMFGKEI